MHTQANTNSFDHQIDVCNMKFNIHFFVGVKESMKNKESTHKCRCRFEDGVGTCGIVSDIHDTCYTRKSGYQSHVMELSIDNCLHKVHENHYQNTYISDTLKSYKSSRSHQTKMKVFELRSR